MAQLVELIGRLTEPSHPEEGSSTAENGGDSSNLVFSCRCSNVTIAGHLEGDGESSGGKQLDRIRLEKECEKSKHPIYVGYDAPPPERKSRRLSHGRDGELSIIGFKSDPVWRVCYLCDTKLYRAEGKRRGDGPADEAVVMIDRQSGISIPPSLTDMPQLPYSKVSLHAPTSSNFGRPPEDSLAPPPNPALTSHLPLLADPFFLPPPFIPSHPHLRLLCANAVDYLNNQHDTIEGEIGEYIESKAREMQELEERVRGEVEYMWDRYVQGPGMEDVRERERRRSQSIGGSVDRKGKSRADKGGFQPPTLVSPIVGSIDNPLISRLDTATPTFQGGASLLSASISRTSHMPRPPPISDEVDDTIDELAKTYDKTGDQRAQAMSYVFSHMTGAMAGRDGGEAEGEGDGPVENTHGRDSWVDEERSTALRRESHIVKASQGQPEASTKGAAPASALAGGKEKSDKGKQKAKVSFEEAIPEDGEVVANGKDADGDEDNVFDFELEDRPSASTPPTSKPKSDLARSRNLVQETLSTTYASNAPSHRSAHRRLLAGLQDPYFPLLRREINTSTSSEEMISLATSVPIAINLRAGPAARGLPYAFERKTSLSDREGVLVPPLIKAMRQRGVVTEGNSLGLSTASKKEKMVREAKLKADPGPVLETMTDEQNESGEQVGSLRGGKFVPPHVLARKESLKSGDVGWRSMISES